MITYFNPDSRNCLEKLQLMTTMVMLQLMMMMMMMMMMKLEAHN
jgi:hypothetical protein